MERKFIEDAIIKGEVSAYLERVLSKAGFSSVEIQKTPMITRITVWVTNPGRVIGRGGETINALTESIKKKFGIENPQISVSEVTNAMLEPRLVARYIANALERGANARSLLHSVLEEIMENGAMGAEVVATGKLAAKGAKSKQIKLKQGYIPKAGNVTKLVKEAQVTAYPKYGAIGVLVRIVKPGTVFPQPKTKQKRQKTEIIGGSTQVQPQAAQAAQTNASEAPSTQQNQAQQTKKEQAADKQEGEQAGGKSEK